MDQQPGYDPYATPDQSGFEQSSYDASAYQSNVGSQSQLSTMTAEPQRSSLSSTQWWSIAVACVLFMFVAVAVFVFVTDRNVSELPEEDVEYFGGGGGGGGRGGSSGPPVSYPSPVVTTETMTGTGGPQPTSTGATPYQTSEHPTPAPPTPAPPTPAPPTPAPPTPAPPTPAPPTPATPTRAPPTPAPTTRLTTRRPTPTPPRFVTTTTRRPRPSPTIPVPSGPPAAALPLPSYPYVCTVSEPVRTSVGYLPVDGMCDYMFYDSLYKNGKSNFLSGITQLELAPQYFIFKAVMYSKTKMGLSFAPEPVLLDTDSKNPKFFTVIDEIWGKTVSHFGFLNLYREYLDPDTVTKALTLLKELYLYLKPKTSTTRPSYYVIGLSLAGTSNIDLLNLMKTVFTPSMFIAISHLSYPVRTFNDCRIFPVAMDVLPRHLVRGRDYTYGHTVNESLAILREVDKMGLSIPLAISFSLKGVYYAPKFANPSSPNPNEFQLFKPCEDHSKPYYDDPHNLCKQTQGNWIPQKSLPVLAHNIDQKKAMTYLTEITVAQLACEGKVFNLKLNFALAAYDADFDQGAKCPRLGFDIFGGSYNRLLNMRKVMDFLRNSYTSAKDNFDCQSVAVNLPF